MLTSKISNVFIPYLVYFSSLLIEYSINIQETVVFSENIQVR